MNKTVMIIDDSVSVRQAVGLTLSGSGYNIIEANDGIDALSKLSGEKIHIIICDVNMPYMDGITFVKSMKENPKYSAYRFTPVIMLTTESDENMKHEGSLAGTNAWVVKPFLPESLMTTVQKLSLP